MNHVGHYELPAAMMAEIFVWLGLSKEDAAQRAILIATADQMVDWATPKNRPISEADKTGVPPPTTQVYPSWAARLMFGGGSWPSMERCHKWHFNPENGWPKIREIQALDTGFKPNVLIVFGMHLHTATDTDGPHAFYTGFPSKKNYAQTAKLGQLSWYEKVLPVRNAWGHMLDPEADQIQRCRDMALKTFQRLKPPGMPQMQTTIAIIAALDDKDLAVRCRRIFKDVTGVDLPTYKPFDGICLTMFENEI